MLWRIELAPSALADLKAAENYHEQFDPDYAQALIQRIFHRIETLENFPYRGKLVKVEGKEYLQLLEKPYRILYRMEEPVKVVYIVAILHQVQDLLTAWRARHR